MNCKIRYFTKNYSLKINDIIYFDNFGNIHKARKIKGNKNKLYQIKSINYEYKIYHVYPLPKVENIEIKIKLER